MQEHAVVVEGVFVGRVSDRRSKVSELEEIEQQGQESLEVELAVEIQEEIEWQQVCFRP